MKKIFSLPLFALSLLIGSCNGDKKTTEESSTSDAVVTGGQEAVKDDESAKDVVKVAVGSKAVSYTHLDVYKRQHNNGRTPVRKTSDRSIGMKDRG